MKRGTDYRQAFVVLCGFSGPTGTSLWWAVTDFSLKEKEKEVRYHVARNRDGVIFCVCVCNSLSF